VSSYLLEFWQAENRLVAGWRGDDLLLRDPELLSCGKRRGSDPRQRGQLAPGRCKFAAGRRQDAVDQPTIRVGLAVIAVGAASSAGRCCEGSRTPLARLLGRGVVFGVGEAPRREIA